MAIYTGTGDQGRTSLFSGERVSKNERRVAAYGSIDELCSHIGLVQSALPPADARHTLSAALQQVQRDLFVMGALLATAPDSEDVHLLQPFDGAMRTGWLEEKIDAMQAELAELQGFILPGGHLCAAHAQVARTVCRRAEREVIDCMEMGEGVSGEGMLAYMNRLSDFFFVLARYINKMTGTAEIHWHE